MTCSLNFPGSNLSIFLRVTSRICVQIVKPGKGWYSSSVAAFGAIIFWRCFSMKIHIISPWKLEKWWMVYTLWKTNIAMDNHHFSWENSLSMAIFSSYVTNYQRVMENTKSPKNGSPKEWKMPSLHCPYIIMWVKQS